MVGVIPQGPRPGVLPFVTQESAVVDHVVDSAMELALGPVGHSLEGQVEVGVSEARGVRHLEQAATACQQSHCGNDRVQPETTILCHHLSRSPRRFKGFRRSSGS